ncbi:MAG: hypothetical protein M1833_003158 [Piccolia ochrophora]|nr:MAG: hypothetical protein M1833_003158 [Piccolia ochrophora]
MVVATGLPNLGDLAHELDFGEYKGPPTKELLNSTNKWLKAFRFRDGIEMFDLANPKDVAQDEELLRLVRGYLEDQGELRWPQDEPDSTRMRYPHDEPRILRTLSSIFRKQIYNVRLNWEYGKSPKVHSQPILVMTCLLTIRKGQKALPAPGGLDLQSPLSQPPRFAEQSGSPSIARANSIAEPHSDPSNSVRFSIWDPKHNQGPPTISSSGPSTIFEGQAGVQDTSGHGEGSLGDSTSVGSGEPLSKIVILKYQQSKRGSQSLGSAQARSASPGPPAVSGAGGWQPVNRPRPNSPGSSESPFKRLKVSHDGERPSLPLPSSSQETDTIRLASQRTDERGVNATQPSQSQQPTPWRAIAANMQIPKSLPTVAAAPRNYLPSQPGLAHNTISQKPPEASAGAPLSSQSTNLGLMRHHETATSSPVGPMSSGIRRDQENVVSSSGGLASSGPVREHERPGAFSARTRSIDNGIHTVRAGSHQSGPPTPLSPMSTEASALSESQQPPLKVTYMVYRACPPRIVYKEWKGGRLRGNSLGDVVRSVGKLAGNIPIVAIKFTLETSLRNWSFTLTKDAEDEFAGLIRKFKDEMNRAVRRNQNEGKDFVVVLEPMVLRDLADETEEEAIGQDF